MPPPGALGSQKGTGKKASGAKARSRNTTPMSSIPAAVAAAAAATSAASAAAANSSNSIPAIEYLDSELLDIRYEYVRPIVYDDIIDQSTSSVPNLPDSKALDALVAKLEKLRDIIDRRGIWCDKAMRLVASEKKGHVDEPPQVASTAGASKAHEGEKKPNKKKRKANDPLGPGEHSIERSSPMRDSKPRKASRENGSVSSSLSPPAQATAGPMEVDDKLKLEKNDEEEEEDKDDDDDEDESSEDEHAPPRRELPQAQTFGEDPSTFPDPTVYEIREAKPGMSVDELKEIYSVAVFPKTDLRDQIAGDPPDKDFSSAKPTNQISFSTFSSYIEPYFRPFAEEDLTFLRERGDRVTPFIMPKRGRKHYTEVWAEEEGAMAVDANGQSRDKLAPNQPRGNIDVMDDDVAETDKLSVGPVLSRLLQAMRPEARALASEDKPMTNGINGLNGLNGLNGGGGGDGGDGGGDAREDANGEVGGNAAAGEETKSLPAAAFMPESTGEAWKKSTHPKLDYLQVDERIKQELRHIGFLPQEGFDGDYDGHFDDEVAARLRLLQDRLRDQMLINGARKARLTELVKERMAHQEYQTILEDLDSQVQGAYLKRTRTMGKSKKSKRPGGAGGGSHAAGGAGAGMARPGIGDVTKTLMERRRRWIDNIGTVFDDENLGKVPRASDPDSSIFKPEIMADLIKKERQSWDEEVEDE